MKTIIVSLFLVSTLAFGQTVDDVRKAAQDAAAKSLAVEEAARAKATPVPTPAPASPAELKALMDALKAAANDPAKAPMIRVINFHLLRPGAVLTSPQAKSFTAQLARRPPPPLTPITLRVVTPTPKGRVHL